MISNINSWPLAKEKTNSEYIIIIIIIINNNNNNLVYTARDLVWHATYPSGKDVFDDMSVEVDWA